MGRNMPFDDIAFWVGRCHGSAGLTLELGCGSGRITARLAAAGIPVLGVDRSTAMLQQLRLHWPEGVSRAPLACADIRTLPFSDGFDAVLCPYSLVTSLATEEDLQNTLTGIKVALRDGGTLSIDAFVPQPIVDTGVRQLAYRRPWRDRILERWQRISPLDDGRNRIEREYRVLAADLTELDRIHTWEIVRPYGPQELRYHLERCGYVIDALNWDYRDGGDEAGARFYAYTCRIR